MSNPDLQVDSEGDIILVNGDLSQVTDDEAIGQAVRIALRAIKGEWFLNTEFGLDHDVIFRRPYSIPRIRREIRRVVFSIPGVVAMGNFQAGFDQTTQRQLNFSFVLKTENNEEIQIQEVIG